jgi:biopolymer transport protein ExbD
MNFGGKARRRVAINITSLVDILIVLLLFFMLTTQFVHMEILNLSLEGDVKVSSKDSVKDSTIFVTLEGGGNFTLNGNTFNLLQLKEKIKPLLDSNPIKDIVIVNKKQASVQDVVTAIDYIKVVGGKNISLAEDK